MMFWTFAFLFVHVAVAEFQVKTRTLSGETTSLILNTIPDPTVRDLTNALELQLRHPVQ